jgi:hypothetical protein
MNGGGQRTSPKMPRALVLATGEEVPQGASIRARMLIIEARAGDVNRGRLTASQYAGGEGRLACAMGGFVLWMAGQYEDLQRRFQAGVREVPRQTQQSGVHARTPRALAELSMAWKLFLEFALESGAITLSENAELEHRQERAFEEIGSLQSIYQENGDPARRFLFLLRAALACGRAHVANSHGQAPADAALWCWRDMQRPRRCQPRGTRIGWVSGDDLFLDPTASYQAAQELAGPERLLVSEQTLRHKLRECGLLASVDQGRGMVQVRRTLQGATRQVLHLRAADLVGNRPLAAETGLRRPIRGEVLVTKKSKPA